MGLVSWMYLHLRGDVHSGTQTQYRSLQTPSRYPLSYRVLIATCLLASHYPSLFIMVVN
ncbi:unnamed protein product [Schistosoma margrebowiei]|uniref:Uncharacterized protein n=1 Tax=Schistosoma margrebowiei TaxID=48269 RepID=A0A3P7XRV5_9TREM|nr:unnamed protein product [Schistosoma margrebowiei]